MIDTNANANSNSVLDLWNHGIARGERMLAFLTQELGDRLESLDVLEIGIGGGGIGIAFRRRVHSIVGGDICPETLRRAAQRTEYLEAPFPLVKLDAVQLPFEPGAFDLVLLNGVLEYMGCRESDGDPITHQIAALREIRRVLRPSGSLYLAIENRWHPRHFLRDPHTHQPFVCFLPRSLADRFSIRQTQRPYRHWIHSLSCLSRMLSVSGFNNVRKFITLPSYQFPIHYVPASKPSALIKALYSEPPENAEDLSAADQLRWHNRAWLTASALAKIQTTVAGSFVLLADTVS